MLSVLVSHVGRTVESGLLLIGLYYYHHVILGFKISLKMGVLGPKSDNLHLYRVGSIDKGFDLDAETAINV